LPLAEENTVKKVLVAAVAAVVGLALWHRMESGKVDEALWAEVTDPVR
jgi:hypothetical protein